MNHCRKSSKAYSKKCSFLIATCTAQGLAKCAYCGRGFDEE
tara:strand:- start:190 stop:312 length:123 start_codon:yes stop_codon:yes gene_type:complete